MTWKFFSKPLPDLSVFCYSVSTSSLQENILLPKRSSFREIVLICIYHIPWFRISLLFVVTTHWDLVTLFLAVSVLSQTSVLVTHAQTWRIPQEYSHPCFWEPEHIFARLSLALWIQAGTYLSCHFLNSQTHQNHSEWGLIWFCLSPGFTYQLFPFLRGKYFVSLPVSSKYLCGHSHTKHNAICISFADPESW